MRDIDSKLAGDIEAFLRMSCFDSHPGHTSGLCLMWTGRLVRYLHGLGYQVDSARFDKSPRHWDGPCEPQPDALGMEDRITIGLPAHHWALVRRAGRIWAVDLTASQYGYEGSMVRWCQEGAEESWTRPGRVELIAWQQFAANRVEAGVPRRCVIRARATCGRTGRAKDVAAMNPALLSAISRHGGDYRAAVV